jgi:hypothetical protein
VGKVPSSEFWAWHAHPEVWLLVGSLAGLYIYAAKVIGPKVVPAGTPAVSRRQWYAFSAAIALLWFASDWPVHDIGEKYLFFVHMSQHLLLTLVMPPLFLIATPRWLADLVLGSGRVRKTVRWLVAPVAAAVIEMRRDILWTRTNAPRAALRRSRDGIPPSLVVRCGGRSIDHLGGAQSGGHGDDGRTAGARQARGRRHHTGQPHTRGHDEAGEPALPPRGVTSVPGAGD